ncbi:MAG: hypothetical protein ACXQTL_02260 [Methanosarcinales archaeon]
MAIRRLFEERASFMEKEDSPVRYIYYSELELRSRGGKRIPCFGFRSFLLPFYIFSIFALYALGYLMHLLGFLVVSGVSGEVSGEVYANGWV